MTKCIYTYRDNDGNGFDLPGEIAGSALMRFVDRGLARWFGGRWEVVLD